MSQLELVLKLVAISPSPIFFNVSNFKSSVSLSFRAHALAKPCILTFWLGKYYIVPKADSFWFQKLKPQIKQILNIEKAMAHLLKSLEVSYR